MKKLQSNQSGFTIIEVLIVLAIAGLIMLIVFLAVPALQRNSRNTSRRNDVSKLLGLVTEYGTNNNGQLPATAGCFGDMILAGAGNQQPVQVTGAHYCRGSTQDLSWSTTATSNTSTIDTVILVGGRVCDGTSGNATASGAGTRNVVALYTLEPNVKQCQSS